MKSHSPKYEKIMIVENNGAGKAIAVLACTNPSSAMMHKPCPPHVTS